MGHDGGGDGDDDGGNVLRECEDVHNLEPHYLNLPKKKNTMKRFIKKNFENL